MGGGSPQPQPQMMSPQQMTQNAVGAAQAQLPISAAGQASSQYNQNTPYGSLNYVQTGTSPQGTPIYAANTSFSPQQQALYNTYTGTQQAAGNQAAGALGFGNYGTISPSQQIGSMTSGTTGELESNYLKSVLPFFQTQYDQLNAQLVNQGFSPDPGGTGAYASDPAYDNAMRQLQTNQANAALGAAAQFENQAFNQATNLYGLPMTVGQQLAQWGAPTNPTTGQTTALPQFATPSVSQNLSAEEQAAADQFNAQQAQYNAQQNAMSGLFGVGGNVLGSLGSAAILGAAL